jgi:NADPH-dependent 2,4-dienoyl-CoA reductase/sulfur reductase-like enzyme
MTERIVVIGADAAGMSAASQAKRIAGDAVEIVAFERGAYSSYSACGIPYWVAGDVDGPERLVARSPEEHRRNGIDLRMRTEVEKIDLAAGRVLAHDRAAGRSFREGFDSLVIATGAVPVRPPLPGADAAGVFGVQTLDDGAALLADLHRTQPRRAVVVGGGYIGVEMAEALIRRGVAVTVVDQAAQPMATLDPDMGAAVRRAMEGIGIDVHTDTAVLGFEADGNHRIRSVLTADGSIPADVVVLGLGVRPNTALAREAGLPLGDHGGLRTNVQMQVLGHDHIWAGGDCVEVLNLVSGQYQHVALGTHANKHGRVIGHNLAGSYATFPGVVGTAVSKVCHLEIARTGLRERDATRAGFKYVTTTVQSGTKAGYFPGTRRMTVKMTAECLTGRLLGVQIVGYEGSAKRIDTAAAALWNRMTVEEMTALDLAYAPPFSPVWDPILVAARQAAGAVREGGAARRLPAFHSRGEPNAWTGAEPETGLATGGWSAAMAAKSWMSRLRLAASQARHTWVGRDVADVAVGDAGASVEDAVDSGSKTMPWPAATCSSFSSTVRKTGALRRRRVRISVAMSGTGECMFTFQPRRRWPLT